MSDIKALEDKLSTAIAHWDRKQRNPNAGGIALMRLDDMLREVEEGKPVAQALYDNFNDRLLTTLENALGLPVTYGGGAHDKGRPS